MTINVKIRFFRRKIECELRLFTTNCVSNSIANQQLVLRVRLSSLPCFKFNFYVHFSLKNQTKPNGIFVLEIPLTVRHGDVNIRNQSFRFYVTKLYRRV